MRRDCGEGDTASFRTFHGHPTWATDTVDCSEGLYHRHWAKSLTVPLARSNLEGCYALLFLLAALSSFVGASNPRVHDDSFLPVLILRVTTDAISSVSRSVIRSWQWNFTRPINRTTSGADIMHSRLQ